MRYVMGMILILVLGVAIIVLIMVGVSYIQRRNTENNLYSNNVDNFYKDYSETSPREPDNKPNLSDEITKLHKLLQDGVITDDEYSKMKDKLINN